MRASKDEEQTRLGDFTERESEQSFMGSMPRLVLSEDHGSLLSYGLINFKSLTSKQVQAR